MMKPETENEKRKMENGKRKMEYGIWKKENEKTRDQLEDDEMSMRCLKPNFRFFFIIPIFFIYFVMIL